MQELADNMSENLNMDAADDSSTIATQSVAFQSVAAKSVKYAKFR